MRTTGSFSIIRNLAIRKFDRRDMARMEANTTELTYQVEPKTRAVAVTLCVSRSKNAAPRKKKCQSGIAELPAIQRTARKEIPSIIAKAERYWKGMLRAYA